MRPEREAAKKFNAMKKYYAYLRVCAFNNAFGKKIYFRETEVLDCLEYVFESRYQNLQIAFRERELVIDFYDNETVSQINELFRLIAKIENKIYPHYKTLMPSVNQKPCFSFAT